MMTKAKSSTMFNSLKEKRNNWEEIWDLCAKYTLPQLYLEDSVRESGLEPEDLVIGDSIGAEALNNFISQILKIVFPVRDSFFRVQMRTGADGSLSRLSPERQQDVFRRYEEAAMHQLYKRGLHAQKFMLLGLLLTLGNVVYKIPKDPNKEIQVYDLNDCVIKRNLNGQVTDIIICEKTEVRFLSAKAVAKLAREKKVYKEDDVVKLYTHVRLNRNGKFEVSQSVDEIDLELGDNFYAEADCEYKVGAINVKRGSHYGVGQVQQYIPLIHKANVYADTATDTAVAGSIVTWAVSPSAGVRPEEFANREQGQPFGVRPDDIKAIVADVGANYQMTIAQYEQIARTLARVFLLPQAVQRDAERVTAEEIRMIAAKLEETHSGLYAAIANTIQRPMADTAIELVEDEELVKYKDEIEVNLVTAMEAQSRSAELENLMAAAGDTTIFNSIPPQVQEEMKLRPFLSTILANRNVDASKYVKTDEERQEELQQQQEAEAAANGQTQQPALNQSQVFQPNQGLLDKLNQGII